jgi:hypothetical protein
MGSLRGQVPTGLLPFVVRHRSGSIRVGLTSGLALVAEEVGVAGRFPAVVDRFDHGSILPDRFATDAHLFMSE